MLACGERWTNSRCGSAGVPWARHHSSKVLQVPEWVRSNSARNADQSERSSVGYPEKVGGTSAPRISSGVDGRTRTNAPSAVVSAGNATTLSSTRTSGRCRAMISRSCGSQYIAPSIRAWYVGCTNVASWSRVGLANSGAVSAMKSIQNWPAGSSVGAGVGSGGGAGVGEVAQVPDEPIGLDPSRPRRLGREDDPVPLVEQHLPETDALVGR